MNMQIEEKLKILMDAWLKRNKEILFSKSNNDKRLLENYTNYYSYSHGISGIDDVQARKISFDRLVDNALKAEVRDGNILNDILMKYLDEVYEFRYPYVGYKSNFIAYDRETNQNVFDFYNKLSKSAMKAEFAKWAEVSEIIDDREYLKECADHLRIIGDDETPDQFVDGLQPVFMDLHNDNFNKFVEVMDYLKNDENNPEFATKICPFISDVVVSDTDNSIYQSFGIYEFDSDEDSENFSRRCDSFYRLIKNVNNEKIEELNDWWTTVKPAEKYHEINKIANEMLDEREAIIRDIIIRDYDDFKDDFSYDELEQKIEAEENAGKKSAPENTTLNKFEEKWNDLMALNEENEIYDEQNEVDDDLSI